MRINATREYISWLVVRRRCVVTLDLKRYTGHNYGGFEVSGVRCAAKIAVGAEKLVELLFKPPFTELCQHKYS